MHRQLMRPLFCLLGLAVAMCAFGQGYPSGQGGGGRPPVGGGGSEIPFNPTPDKPEAAARKAYAAGMKSMTKARDYEKAAAAAPNADKKAGALEKMGDAYNRALDLFTEALSNKGDMVEAWNNVGYIHWRLGAYAEAVDDYDHTLALRPDFPEAVEHRGESYLGLDRLEDAKRAYMDLFNHTRPLADQLMTAMQKWMEDHRSNAGGMRASDVAAFDVWLKERDGIAKQTAS